MPNLKLPRTALSWKWLRFSLPVVALVINVGVRPGQWFQPKSVALMTQAVERKTVPMTITANGVMEADRSINLSPKSSGVIKSLLVKEGDRVRQGQVMAVMDDANLQGQLTQMRGQLAQQEANLQRLLAGSRAEDVAKAEAQLVEAEANLQQLQSGNRPQEIAQVSARLQQAQASLRLKEEDVRRYQSLFDQGAISQQALDQKLTDRDMAKMQVVEAEQSLSLQNAGARPEQIDQAQARVNQQAQSLAALKAGSRPEDIAQAKAQVESARGALQTVEAQLKDLQVVAPFDGVVLKVSANVGSFVSPSVAGGGGESSSSSSIFTFASDRNHVETYLSESQIRNIKVGQTVHLKVDAFPGEKFQGSVGSISPQATISQNVTSFEVKVVIPQSIDRLKAGMNAEAEFEIGNLENALLVPNAAVVRQAEGQGIYVLDEKQQPRFQKIETGMTVQGQTQVKSGLQGNEQVLISPPAEQKKSGGISFPPASAK